MAAHKATYKCDIRFGSGARFDPETGRKVPVLLNAPVQTAGLIDRPQHSGRGCTHHTAHHSTSAGCVRLAQSKCSTEYEAAGDCKVDTDRGTCTTRCPAPSHTPRVWGRDKDSSD